MGDGVFRIVRTRNGEAVLQEKEDGEWKERARGPVRDMESLLRWHRRPKEILLRLDGETKARLSNLAAKKGISMQEVIRRAIGDLLQREGC